MQTLMIYLQTVIPFNVVFIAFAIVCNSDLLIDFKIDCEAFSLLQ